MKWVLGEPFFLLKGVSVVRKVVAEKARLAGEAKEGGGGGSGGGGGGG